MSEETVELIAILLEPVASGGDAQVGGGLGGVVSGTLLVVVVVVVVVVVLPPQVKVADPEPTQCEYQELLLTDAVALPVLPLQPSNATIW